MENNFSSLVGQANSVLILLAKNPYVDQVAAGLSLYLAINNMGKNVTIASSSEMMVEHNRLVGIDRVTTEPGNKNLVIKFSGYQADNIERVSYDVDGQEFRLTVIPKPQFEPPQKNNIELSYAGIAADLVILVGGMNEGHFPLMSTGQLAQAKLAHIGVQQLSGEGQNQIVSFAEGTASTSELTAQLLKELNVNVDQDIASNLLMGMQEGTRNFSHNRVTAQTFHLAGEMMEKGASLDPRQAEEQKQYPAGAIPGQNLHSQPAKSYSPPQQNPDLPAKPYQAPPTSQQGGQDHDQTHNQQQQGQSEEAPSSWLEPKIFKGTSNK